MKKNNSEKLHKYLVLLIFGAMLVAVSIVLSRIGSINIGNTIRIGFGRVPVFLASLWLGPLGGMAVGAVSDIVGALISTGWNPIITIPAALAGVFPWLLAKVLMMRPGGAENRLKSHLKCILNIFIVHVLTSGVLMTVILNYFYPNPEQGLFALMALRTGIASLEAVAGGIIVCALYNNKYITALISKYRKLC